MWSRCVSWTRDRAPTVRALLKKLTDARVFAGYVTTHAFLGPHNFALGTPQVGQATPRI